jgi:hypothetical protein
VKTWFKSAISILLGILILLTGSGISLAKMNCLKSGDIEITWNTPDDCCKHEHAHAPVTIEEKCCDISSVNIDILHYVVSATQNIQKSLAWFDVSSTLSVLDFGQNDKVVSTIIRQYTIPPGSSSPPIRIFTKTFLI